MASFSLLLRIVSADQRGRAAAAFQGGFLIGGLAGPAVGGIVIAISLRAPFFVYSFTLLFAAAASAFFLNKHEKKDGQQNERSKVLNQLKLLIFLFVAHLFSHVYLRKMQKQQLRIKE